MPSDFYVATAAMHPFHFAAIFLIFVGGFLPAAKGDVRKFGTCSFYKQEAVACCVIGELLIVSTVQAGGKGFRGLATRWVAWWRPSRIPRTFRGVYR